MQASQSLRQLLREQRDQLDKLEQAVAELEQTDLAHQVKELESRGEELLRQNEQLTAQAAQSVGRAEELLADNKNLRVRLAEEMNLQRETLLSEAGKRAQVLFGQADGEQVDRLARYHANLRTRLDALRAELDKFRPLSEELLAQVAALETRSREFMRDASGALQRQMEEARAAEQAERAALGETPSDLSGFERRSQRSSFDSDRMEMRIGMRITVIVGAFFMLLAVVFGLRYSFVHLQSDILKGALAYFIGLVFLGGGELLHRRHPSAFSTGVCAGGIAILFASTAISYFALGIFSIPVAIGICVLVTALALLQAIRYDAQLIAVFALIGGYLPMMAFRNTPDGLLADVENNIVNLLSAMVYFLLINLFVLLVALRRRWQPLKFFSLVAGWASVNYLLIQAGFVLAGGLFYIPANLLMFTAIVLVNPIMRRSVLRVSDTVLLGLNTIYGCCNLFYLLYRNDLTAANGAVALGLCLLFFLLAKWLGVVLEKDTGSRGLFYATSFAFWVLAVPLQFEPELISLFWMIEGVALFVFGTLTGRTWYRRAGGVIGMLCCVSFLPQLVENILWNTWWRGSDGFVWQYGVITLGLLVMVGVALFQYAIGHPYWQSIEGGFVRAFKGISLINLWLFALYLIDIVFADIAYFQDPRNDYLWRFYWTGLLTVIVTLGLGVLCRAVPRLRTKGTVIIARILYAVGLLMVFWVGGSRVPGSGLSFVVALVLLIALDSGAVLACYDFLRGSGRVQPEWLTMGVSVYALAVVLQLMMVQARFGFRSMAVSFVLIAWALGLILYGFIGRHSLHRRFGLGLSLLSISKLFLIDLFFLPEGQRVISYFVFSIVFIGISFVYQYFARRLFPAAVRQKEPPQPQFSGAPAGSAPAASPPESVAMTPPSPPPESPGPTPPPEPPVSGE